MAVNVAPKPTAAFALSALAGLITLITAFVTIQAISIPILTGTMALVWSTIAGIATFVGSWLLFNNAAKRKIGSMLVLVFSLISMNYVGLILGLIGGFLGYTFKGASVTTSNTSGRSFNPP